MAVEPASAAVERALRRDPSMMVWWGSEVECVSAVARCERAGALTADVAMQAIGHLETLRESWQEVQPVDAVRRTAKRLLRVHDLRAADAFQLAAALAGSEGRADSLGIVSLDARLIDAARREGLRIVELG